MAKHKQRQGRGNPRPTHPQKSAHPAPHGGKKGQNPPPGGDDWLFGRHVVLAALANPARPCRRLVLAAQGGAEAEAEAEAAARRGRDLGGSPRPQPEIRDGREIEALLPRGAVHQGFALLAAPPEAPTLPDVAEAAEARGRGLVLVLDRVNDPRNLGATLRSAAAFGADAVVVPDRHAPELTGTVAKAASGAAEVVPVVRVANVSQGLDILKKAGFWCYGLDGTAETALSGADLSGRVALVMGAEGEGLRRLTRETCDAIFRIPIAEGPVESLNMAAAATIALYEASKQRG